MNEDRVIKLYLDGFSIKYITEVYYKYKNRKQKPIKIDGILLYPQYIYKKDDCRRIVSEIIYNYLTRRNSIV